MVAEFFPSSSNLVMAWLISLLITGIVAVLAGLFPRKLEGLRKSAVVLMIGPGLVISLIYSLRGFGVLERPLVHWVFEKGAVDSLRLGLVFDTVSFAVSVIFGLAATAICIRNRPTIRTSSALALSWLSLGLAASAQTLWLAVLGIGVQLLARTFPLIEGTMLSEADDAMWIASSKRAWFGLVILLCGAAGLAAQGVHLDFFSETAWSSLEVTSSAMVASSLLIFGLLVIAAPALASHALTSRLSEAVEEDLFIYEASIAWIAVIVLYRLFANIHEPQWLLAIGIGAAVATFFSLSALLFQTTKGNAIHLWLSSLPVTTLMILPFVPAREAYLHLLGSLLAFGGLWVAMDHRRAKPEIAAAAVFCLAGFGFVGWSTSAGMMSFFSKFETDPFLRGGVLILFLLYIAVGWRLVLRGGDRESNRPGLAKWITLGVFFILGFGPLLSGRFGGGGIPGEPDWIEGAKNWPWIRQGSVETTDSEWVGFGVSQGLVLLTALLGVFAWRNAILFPFAEKYPRAARAAEGLFGLVWLREVLVGVLKRAGQIWITKVSIPIWERGIPAIVGGLLAGFQITGRGSEQLVDPLTSSGYGKLLTPPAKLVQWLHGGNVRLYAWFTLIWILIFSIYLTR